MLVGALEHGCGVNQVSATQSGAQAPTPPARHARPWPPSPLYQPARGSSSPALPLQGCHCPEAVTRNPDSSFDTCVPPQPVSFIFLHLVTRSSILALPTTSNLFDFEPSLIPLILDLVIEPRAQHTDPTLRLYQRVDREIRSPPTMNIIYSTVNSLRDRYTPASTTSTFRKTGEITPEEFVEAGDYLVFKFPSWSWADAETPAKRISHLPPNKQYLVTRHVPCHRRLNDDFAGDAGHEEAVVEGGKNSDDDGWLRTGGLTSSQPLKVREVRTMDDSGNVGDREVIEEDDIPDMEDEEDDEAIIRDADADGKNR